MRKSLVLGSLAAAVAASAASADVIVFTQLAAYNIYGGATDSYAVSENFDAYNGYYNSPLAGNSGGVNWLATATGGIYASGGLFSTNNPTGLTFSFDDGAVRGVGGNFFATDINFNVVPSYMLVSLNDGTSYFGEVTSASAFLGFYSTGASITSVTIGAMPSGGSGSVYPTVDNFQIAATPIPAPGAIALLGLAGLAGRRRR
ncbi:MAG: hypothetical protein ACO3IB_02985 [Phycisphaerales bacterium]